MAGQVAAVSPGSSAPLISVSSPFLPRLRLQPPAWSGPATAGAAELAETESKLFNDNDDLDKHNNNDSSALKDSSKIYTSTSSIFFDL